MQQQQHVYDWLRGRGYWVTSRASAPRLTHLMMDGGMACVADEAASSFLNAYAASLVRHPQRPPSIVELRTDVFKLFVDLDTRFDTTAADGNVAVDACVAAAGPVLRRLWACVASHLPSDADPAMTTMVVCCASATVVSEGTTKLGFHVVWPHVTVRAPTALALRSLVLQALADVPCLGPSWDAVFDASVYRANGLRMPWSAKGRHDGRVYTPVQRWQQAGAAGEPAVEPVERPRGVAAVREWVRLLSIRTPDAAPSLSIAADEQPGAGGTGTTASGDVHVASLAGYADALRLLAGCLPVQFLGQRFTAVMHHGPGAAPGGAAALTADKPTAYLLRSTARYCFNLGRAHRTNNVYFVLTRRGIRQRCYCRCETVEGRRFGMCQDFASDTWPVPPEVTGAFFGQSEAPPAAPPHPAVVQAMPSRAHKAFLSREAIFSRSRPSLTATQHSQHKARRPSTRPPARPPARRSQPKPAGGSAA